MKGKRESNVLFFDRVANLLHSCQKPLDLISYLIEKSSDEGQTILDPFGGSGSTNVSAKMQGRNSIYIDTQKKNIDIALKRMNFSQQELFDQHTYEVRMVG